MTSFRSRFGRFKKIGIIAATSALIGATSVAPATAYPDGPWFVPDKPYAQPGQWVPGYNISVGDLADPDIFQENGTYYAYGTTMGGRNVPLVTSTDLKNWKTNPIPQNPPTKASDGREVNHGEDPFYNDTLALPGSWVQSQPGCGNPKSNGCYEIWAPSVEKVGNKYVMAYVGVQDYRGKVAGDPNVRRCIGLATSTSPRGPFYDTMKTPFVCDDVNTDPNGSLDPDLFKDPKTGKVYFYWKNEGKPDNQGRYPTRFHVRELTNDLKLRNVGVEQDRLLETSRVTIPGRNSGYTWQKELIENPSMVYWKGSYYMFYSGNDYNTLNYGAGYAKCDSPTGGCKMISTPLLRTNVDWGIGGPGGASAFVDKAGNLRVAYAAWRAERAGYDNTPDRVKCQTWQVFFGTEKGCTSNQRFLHIGTVQQYGKNNLLAIPKKSEFAWSAPNKYPQAKTFTDTAGSSFAAEINWLAAVGVSNGNPDGTFGTGTGDIVHRAAMAAFLYRLAGSPEYKAPGVSPFRDVPTNHQFYKEISWLVSTGVTTGWPDGTYRPDAPVNRATMAAFMYRMVGTPSYNAPARSVFRDVPTGQQFYKEISWMASTGVTTGWPDGTFRLEESVNRATMAAFMYRLTQLSDRPLIAQR